MNAQKITRMLTMFVKHGIMARPNSQIALPNDPVLNNLR